MRVYWEANQGRGRPFERAFTKLARAGVRIEYDYSAVEALQVSYTERLMRVSTWVGLGAAPDAAADYEGFDEAPVSATVEDFHSPRPIDRQPEEPQDDRDKALIGRVRAAVELHLRASEVVYEEAEGASWAGDEVDTSLVVRWQTERLFHALSEAGVGIGDARWWAEEICAVTHEAHRMGIPEAFDPTRAARIAADITRRAA